MSTPFLSEIRMISFNFAPKGWALCNGQFLPINQNQALFSLLGTTYGGNGQTTFELPNLQGRVPISFGSGFTLGQSGGQTAVTVNVSTMPTHFHSVNGVNTAAGTTDPTNNSFAVPPAAVGSVYASGNPNVALAPQAIGVTGGSQAHQNMQPFLTVGFCIALQGIFPSQT